MIKKWEKSGPEETLFDKFGKYVKKQLFIDPRDGSTQEYIFVGEPDSVGIVALTKDNQIILVRQFKQAANEILTEIPAGVMDKDELPLEAAKRELEEETGYASDNIRQVGNFMRSTRSIPSRSYCFLATDCRKAENPKLDEEEDLEVVLRSWPDWVEDIKKSGHSDAFSVITTFLALEHLKDGK